MTVRVATPNARSASELVATLGTCGLPSEVTRVQGRKVQLVCPDERELENRLADIVHAVEMWLCSPEAPESVEIKGGGQTLVVQRP